MELTANELKKYNKFLMEKWNPDMHIPLSDGAALSYIAQIEKERRDKMISYDMKQRRNRLGLSIASVSTATGVNPSSINRMENGANIKASNKEKISELYSELERNL